MIILALVFQSEVMPQSCLPNGITFSTQSEIDNFQINHPNCSEIEGNVIISGSDINDLTGLNVINSYWSDLFIWNNDSLTNLSGLENVTSVNGSILIGSHEYGANPSLISLSGLDNLSHIGGDLRLSKLYSLTDISALNKIDTIWGTLTFLLCKSLTDLYGIDSLRYIGGSLEIIQNKCLNELNSLINVTSIGKELAIYYNDSISNLYGLNNISYIGEHLWITGNPHLTTLDGLNSLEFVGESVSILSDTLENLHGLSSLSIINDGGIMISSNTLSDLTGLENLIEINGPIIISYCNSLVSLEGIENISPESITLLRLKYNPLLTTCEVESVCSFINQSWSVTDIDNNAFGCSTLDEIEEACQIVKVNNIQHGNELFFHPNPAKNKIEFSKNIAGRIIDLKIYNQFGQQIISDQNIINSVDISKLSRGIYIIEIKTINSKIIQKLILQ